MNRQSYEAPEPDYRDAHLTEPGPDWEPLALACDLAVRKCLCGQYGHEIEDCPVAKESKQKFWAGFWPESWT